MADKDFKVKTGLDLPAPLPASEGGTGQTTLANALNALLPSQTNNTSKILGSDGTNTVWVNPGASYQTSAPNNPVTGQLWVDSDETGDSLDPYIIRRKTITATAGQTVFITDVVFTDGYEQIYYNGVLLVRTTDYTTSGGTNTVTLLQGASAGDTVEIISSTPINLINTVVTGAANIITAPNASAIPLTIQGAASQTASLFNIANSLGETRHEFLANGTVTSRGTASDQSSLRIERYTDDLAVLALRSFGGTISSPTAKTNATRVGMIVADAYDGTNTTNVGRISFWVDGAVSTGNVPGMIQFNTVPVGGGHTERMRINSAGNVGIGVSNNDYNAYGGKLTVANGGQASMFMWNIGQGSGHIGFPASGSTMRIVNTYTDGLIANGKGLDIDTNGTIYAGASYVRNTSGVNNAAIVASGVGMASSTYNYVVSGTNNVATGCVIFINGSTRAEDNGANALTIRNDFANMYLGRSGGTTFIYGRSDVSDQDLKENIQTYSNGVDIIKSLVPKQFNFIGSERNQYGFIAQDIESEEIVLPGGEGRPWSVDYNSIVSALVKANQELVARVELLEATNE